MTHEEALEQWLAERRSYIGGSEAFELLERPQYGKGCRRALAYRKLGAEPDVLSEDEDEALFRRGELLEPITAGEYMRQTQRKLRRPEMDEYGFPKVKRHPEYHWAGVSTDRLILAFHGGTLSPGDLEIKTRGEGPFHRILRKGPFDGDLLQVQWSLWIRNHSWGALAILGVFGSLPLVHFDVRRDLEIHDIFERVGTEFAEQVWVKNEPPAPTFPATDQRCRVCVYRLTCRGEQIDYAEAAALRQVKQASKDLVQITNNELATTLSHIDLLKQEVRSIQGALEIAREQAMEQLGDTDAALLHGYGKVFKLPSQANYFDAQALKADNPVMYDKYMVHRFTGGHYLKTYPE